MTTSTRPTIAPGTYRIDPHRSTVAFTVRELLGVIRVRGTFAVCEGGIVVADDPLRSTSHATIDAGSLRTGNRRRDKDVTAPRFLDTAAYPTMTFTTTSLASGPDGLWSLTGALTVRGITREVALDVTDVSAVAGGCRVQATTRVDRYAFGVTAGKGLISQHVDITLDITARTAG